MSYKIRIPSENSDSVGRFAVTAGTPDYVITFPNESGEVATTSDIPPSVPPTIYKRDPSYIAHVRTTTTPTNLDNTLVTGLESNYMYKITFMGEAYLIAGGFNYNFKFQLTTQNGSQIGLGDNTDMLFTSQNGGFTLYNTGTLYSFYPVYYNLINDGWSVVINSSNGYYGSVCFSTYFTTGTTADSRSIVVNYAKGSNIGGWENYDSCTLYGAVAIVEPIKSIA